MLENFSGTSYFHQGHVKRKLFRVDGKVDESFQVNSGSKQFFLEAAAMRLWWSSTFQHHNDLKTAATATMERFRA